MENSNEIEKHIDHFRLRTHRKARSHYLTSKAFSLRHVSLGVPIIVITAIVGSSVLVEATDANAILNAKMLGILSLIAAILSSFQTFFGFSNLSEKHRNAGSQYSSLYRNLSLLRAKHASGEYTKKTLLNKLDEIQRTWDAVEQEAADVPDRFYDRAKSEQLADDEGV